MDKQILPDTVCKVGMVPTSGFIYLNEKIKTIWVDLNWLDMRSARLGSLSQHHDLLQLAVDVLCDAGVGTEDCVMLHRYH